MKISIEELSRLAIEAGFDKWEEWALSNDSEFSGHICADEYDIGPALVSLLSKLGIEVYI